MKNFVEIMTIVLIIGIFLAGWYFNYRYYRHIKPVYKIWITVASAAAVTGMILFNYLYNDMPLKNLVLAGLFWICVIAYQIKVIRYEATIKSLQEKIKRLQGAA